MSAEIKMKYLHEEIPANVRSWLLDQPKSEYDERVDNLFEEFGRLLYEGTFLAKEEIDNISIELVQKEFKKGNHTKLFSKKMRAKIDGNIVVKHFPLKQTAVFVEVCAPHRKKVGYNFSVVNYFKTPGGYVYFLRHGVPYPAVFAFTGHFFDRVLQRSIGTDDMSARMTAVFRLLRQLDRRLTKGGEYIFTFPETGRSFLASLGGLCLGVGAAYKALDPIFDFTETSKSKFGVSREMPRNRFGFFFLTFVNKEKFCPEQEYIYKALLPPGEKE